MSYEYKLVFDDTSITQRVMNAIKNNDACVHAEHGDIYLKDRALNNNTPYDARLIYGNENSLWLQVNVKSANLYALVLNTLSDSAFKCFEDGDAESEVELNEAFRLKNGQ
ncbi:hypothetical protein [Pectobacterium punjabense]|uniref:hypothetical protein n=1 Tax=Pectobacterium punjabense TaxID=2108399 RepID=UPI001968E4A6|nr:hypothetical protein [Pectobacterium punjabense]MBN3135884.1 hypothetical protein [Pectobacterium punjabense]MBT9185167.1 hypothetical protein [Pectobacterium punjabense]MCE5380776.1 hypothetical protein [Pectobacterium punjabense]